MEQDGGSSIGSSVTSGTVSQSIRSGVSSFTGASASTASRLTISSFCSSQLELDESRPIPREVAAARLDVLTQIEPNCGLVHCVTFVC